LTPQGVRFFAKNNGAKKRPTCSAIYAGVIFLKEINLANGDFGLGNESIIIKSGIREVFTPHIPVDEITNFFGREDEATRLVSVIDSPGQHILLYGDRGVGKTSLAKTTCKVILQKIQRGHFFEKRCDSGDTFASIFEEPLEKSGIDLSFKKKLTHIIKVVALELMQDS
jgi:hypothetical protein